MIGLIVAGGAGTRMDHPLPKPLVPVRSRSLIEINALRLFDAGADPIFFALHHRAQEIRAHLEARLPRHVPARWILEQAPLGTIGALRHLRDLDELALVANADLLSGIDLRGLVQGHAETRPDLTIATHEEAHRLRLGEIVSDEDGRVLRYLERPLKRYRISSGTYLCEPSVARLIHEGESIGVPELTQRALDAGLRVREHFHRAPWVDVNDREDLAEAERLYDAHPEAFPRRPDSR